VVPITFEAAYEESSVALFVLLSYEAVFVTLASALAQYDNVTV